MDEDRASWLAAGRSARLGGASDAASVWLLGSPPIEVRLRVNPRARRLILRVPPAGTAAVLTLPPRATRAAVAAFLREREPWLRQRLAAAGGVVAVREGVVLPFRGGTLTLQGGARRPAVADGALLLPGAGETLGARAAEFLKVRARKECLGAVTAHARRLGRPWGRISLRDTRSRWGSCTAAGDLMFSWRLIMAPPEVLDYVAAHEVAHLVEMNHSPRFWALVARLSPDHAAPRAWLRREGVGLHAFDFSPAAAWHDPNDR